MVFNFFFEKLTLSFLSKSVFGYTSLMMILSRIHEHPYLAAYSNLKNSLKDREREHKVSKGIVSLFTSSSGKLLTL